MEGKVHVARCEIMVSDILQIHTYKFDFVLSLSSKNDF